jgi:hypothetical protein
MKIVKDCAFAARADRSGNIEIISSRVYLKAEPDGVDRTWLSNCALQW